MKILIVIYCTLFLSSHFAYAKSKKFIKMDSLVLKTGIDLDLVEADYIKARVFGYSFGRF